jgi:hypothetical protein
MGGAVDRVAEGVAEGLEGMRVGVFLDKGVLGFVGAVGNEEKRAREEGELLCVPEWLKNFLV